MSVLLVGYDLSKPGRDYPKLHAAIERYEHCHALDSMWFIDTKQGPAEVRDALCKVVDKNDQLYVMRLQRHWAACRTDPCTEWLKSSARTWD